MSFCQIAVWPLGSYQTNCYLVRNTETQQVVVVDPGDEGARLVEAMEREGWHPEAILLTHAHSDHIGGVDALVDRYGVPVYLQEGDAPKLHDPALNLSASVGGDVRVQASSIPVHEGMVCTHAGFSFQVLETPGHTAGGVCYYLASEGVLFAGDTLFQGSIGRTDFVDGNYAQLLEGIVQKLYTLPGETVVCPGHGPHTTIEKERQSNPFTLELPSIDKEGL